VAWEREALYSELPKPVRIGHSIGHQVQKLLADGNSQLAIIRIVANRATNDRPNGGERLIHHCKRNPDPSSCRAYRDRTLSSVLMTDRLRRVSQRCQKRTSVFVTRLREKRYSSRSSCRPPSSLWRAPHRVPCRASQHRSCGHRRMALGFATNEILGLITHDPLVNSSPGIALDQELNAPDAEP
jgi:hypothetical protein